MRLIDYFDRGVMLNSSRVCLRDEDADRTYSQVQCSTFRIANALLRDGFTTGSKAAVYSPNAAAAFECVLGILRAAGVWVPVNAKSALSENVHVINSCDVEVLFFHGDFAENASELASHCPKLRLLVCIAGESELAPALPAWLADVPATDPDIAQLPEAMATLFCSGGTTGLPKGVIYTNSTWQTIISTFHICMPSRESPVNLVVAPMTHAAGGIAIMLMALGTTYVIHRAFDAARVLRAIEEEKVTHLFLPPSAIYSLLAQPDLSHHDYSSLEYFIYAASPMSVEKLKECITAFGPVMAQCYGQTEIPLLCTFLAPHEHVEAIRSDRPERLASCGRPTFFNQVAFIDDTAKLLEDGERGEIVVRGDLVMAGYYNNAVATQQATVDGWHCTGDIGYRDAQGYIYIIDRKKDMIISGGFNVFPSEIEQILWMHPTVQDCAVIGVPDEKWGEAVKAIVELKPGRHALAEDLISHCKASLGSVKSPKTIEFWPALPRTPAGKVRKKEIRDKYWAGHDRTI